MAICLFICVFTLYVLNVSVVEQFVYLTQYTALQIRRTLMNSPTLYLFVNVSIYIRLLCSLFILTISEEFAIACIFGKAIQIFYEELVTLKMLANRFCFLSINLSVDKKSLFIDLFIEKFNEI